MDCAVNVRYLVDNMVAMLMATSTEKVSDSLRPKKPRNFVGYKRH